MTAVGSSRFDSEEPAFARKKEKHKYGWIGVREKRLDQGLLHQCLLHRKRRPGSDLRIQMFEFRFPSRPSIPRFSDERRRAGMGAHAIPFAPECSQGRA